MILPNMPAIYLKTTETCNLNCRHCFTSGSRGRKIYFNVNKTLDFFQRLATDCKWIKGARFIYHGGEPMLAPLRDLIRFREEVLGILPESTFSLQTNLVYRLTDPILDFFKSLKSFGVSWDHDIRFEFQSQRAMWEKNVEILKDMNLQLTMVVSMSKKLLEEKRAIEIVEYAHTRGFKHILFERITPNGNANKNPDIMPSNKDADRWVYDMYQDTIAGKWYDKIGNMMLATLAEGIYSSNHVATACRICEQTILTINADGTVSGCPNSAPEMNWGTIDEPVFDLLKSSARIKSITCEAERNPICYTCEYFSICNGGCHQLAWEGEMCAQPKALFSEGIKIENRANFKELLF